MINNVNNFNLSVKVQTLHINIYILITLLYFKCFKCQIFQDFSVNSVLIFYGKIKNIMTLSH